MTDVGHDRGDDVLLNREWPRVEGHAEERNIRQIASPCFADRVRKKQGDHLFERVGSAQGKKFQWPMKTSPGNLNGRISEVEELVDTRDEDSQNDAKDPSTESRRGHHRIIRVGDRRSNFNVRRIIL
jgi:hypothetical protein